MMKMLHDTCIVRSSMDESKVADMSGGKFPDDATMKKYISCLWTSTVITDSGSIDMDMVNEMCPPKIKEKGPKILQDCFDKNAGAPNLDDKLYSMTKCMYETNSEDFIIF
ncbi:unnamed protein product [Acanthoscelides obtectus]|nr:unnamed protein product [Acanthoscelides obtectus]CAK1675224.1 hypothetical protein AOBTE_LOCUS30066 [Acanthoscelides obtectus]